MHIRTLNFANGAYSYAFRFAEARLHQQGNQDPRCFLTGKALSAEDTPWDARAVGRYFCGELNLED